MQNSFCDSQIVFEKRSVYIEFYNTKHKKHLPMNFLKKITNGHIIILIGLLHTHLVVTADGCGVQFAKFAKTYFFSISNGMEQLPAMVGRTDFESFAAFWFFYFGLIMLPFGIAVHHLQKLNNHLPLSLTLGYLIVVLIGCYMVPNSGMTIIMLPHALFMILRPLLRKKVVTA